MAISSASQTRLFLPGQLMLACGWVPIAAVHLAWLVNLGADSLPAEFRCFPYTDGCVSISRAVRSGPGLELFRAAMMPLVPVLFASWWMLGCWLQGVNVLSRLRARWIAGLGATAAVFLLLYAGWLGTDGGFYSFLRRSGVVVYFAFTALAQLLLLHACWGQRHQPWLTGRRTALSSMFVLVFSQWLLGLASVPKRLLLTDPQWMDQAENVIEWWFALAMCCAFLPMAALLKGARLSLNPDSVTRES